MAITISTLGFLVALPMAVSRARGDQSGPSVSGDWVVWSDDRSTDSEADIYGYNLATKETRVICGARGKQLYPRVSGSWVAWQDHRNKAASGSDIYLTSGKEYAVCTDPGDQSYPAVSGRWRQERLIDVDLCASPPAVAMCSNPDGWGETMYIYPERTWAHEPHESVGLEATSDASE